MDYDTNRPPSSSGGALAVFVLLLLLAGVFVVGAGAFFWVRSRAVRQEAILVQVAEMEAVARAESARAQAESARAQANFERAQAANALPTLSAAELIEVTPSAIRELDFSIMVDHEGRAELRGAILPLDELTAKLVELSGENRSGPTITIWADKDCTFQRLAGVLSACRAAGAETIQLAVMADQPQP